MLRNKASLWSIILAGGEGRRLQPLVTQWFGRKVPKQYCSFVGTRSMFQHTIDRADRITLAEQKVIVIAPAHHREVLTQLAGRHPGKLIVQPRDCDTASGIFLPLAYIRAYNPQATVVVYPSDHFVYPEKRFNKTVRSAARALSLLPNRLILLAVSADEVEPEYGWIHPGRELGSLAGRSIWTVNQFCEKPNPQMAMKAFASGWL